MPAFALLLLFIIVFAARRASLVQKQAARSAPVRNAAPQGTGGGSSPSAPSPLPAEESLSDPPYASAAVHSGETSAEYVPGGPDEDGCPGGFAEHASEEGESTEEHSAHMERYRAAGAAVRAARENDDARRRDELRTLRSAVIMSEILGKPKALTGRYARRPSR